MLVTFEYDDGCRNYNMDGDCTVAGETGGFRTPVPGFAANGDTLGSTWGLAHHRESNSLFAAAYMKRHARFRRNGETGRIYRIEDPAGTPVVSGYVDLDALGFATRPGSGDPHPADGASAQAWEEDNASWDWVGKMSFGDIDVSEDGSTLWAVNLFDRHLYSIPVQSTPVGAGDIDRFDIVPQITIGGSAPACPATGDVRPFGLAVHDGLVYVGVTCTAESTVPGSHAGGNVASAVGNAARMRGIVLRFDPSDSSWSEELNFPLDFARGNAIDLGTAVAARWNSWVPVFTPLGGVRGTRNEVVYPKPMLTDIEFHDGNMIIGMRDRFGDQTGYIQRPPTTIVDATYNANGTGCTLAPYCVTGDAVGDMVKACGNPIDGWSFENNASCGANTTAGAGNSQGPGGGEFFFQDQYMSLFTTKSSSAVWPRFRTGRRS